MVRDGRSERLVKGLFYTKEDLPVHLRTLGFDNAEINSRVTIYLLTGVCTQCDC